MTTVGQNEKEMQILRNQQVSSMNRAYKDADRFAAQGDLLAAKGALMKAEALRQSARRMGAKV